MVTVLEIVIITGITIIILRMVTVLHLRSGDCPREEEYSNYDWSFQLHPLWFKEYNLMFMSEIWDGQTNRQTDSTVYRVALQLKTEYARKLSSQIFDFQTFVTDFLL